MLHDRRFHLALSDCFLSPLISYNTVNPEIGASPSGADAGSTVATAALVRYQRA